MSASQSIGTAGSQSQFSVLDAATYTSAGRPLSGTSSDSDRN